MASWFEGVPPLYIGLLAHIKRHMDKKQHNWYIEYLNDCFYKATHDGLREWHMH